MQNFNITIKRYNPSDSSVWDVFVDEAKNGTFLFKRAYMDYHAHRFEDFSLMIFEKNKLVAILPANRKEKTLFSHQGLTYGSLLISTEVSQSLMLTIFDELKLFLKLSGFEKIYYKLVPAIYHKLPCEEDLYALFRHDAKLVVRNCSTTFCIQKSKASPKLRLSRISNYAEKHNLRYELHPNVDAFWLIVEENLMQKYAVSPVHSQIEINLLQSSFPQNIQAVAVYADDKIVAGGVVYLANEVAHLQYAAVSPEGEKMYAGEFLYNLFIHKLFSDYRYFDFGISTENGGRILNEGLIAYKEKFGGHTIVYDHYEIPL
ncbi:MAG: GNAT family N-acetyltransferase [Bacteroidales bacterium]|jgi:hypothetical protein|nr:GNAT family N-acetyltransferase [Bacteroidales bacterium]